MSDVRRLLVIKADIETAMQRDLAPHIRAFAQQELDKVCKQIKEAHAEYDKLFEQQKIDQLNQRMAGLEASNAELLEALEHARSFIIRYGTIKEGAGFVDSPMFSSLYEKMSGAIQKERGRDG